MSHSDQSSIELGGFETRIRFTWTRTDPHIDAAGVLEVDIWNGLEDEAAHTSLSDTHALHLAQWINERLGRD